jgi:hypothetical protein
MRRGRHRQERWWRRCTVLLWDRDEVQPFLRTSGRAQGWRSRDWTVWNSIAVECGRLLRFFVCYWINEWFCSSIGLRRSRRQPRRQVCGHFTHIDWDSRLDLCDPLYQRNIRMLFFIGIVATRIHTGSVCRLEIPSLFCFTRYIRFNAFVIGHVSFVIVSSLELENWSTSGRLKVCLGSFRWLPVYVATFAVGR